MRIEFWQSGRSWPRVWQARQFVTWLCRQPLFTTRNFDPRKMAETVIPEMDVFIACGTIGGFWGTHLIPTAATEVERMDALLQQIRPDVWARKACFNIQNWTVPEDILAGPSVKSKCNVYVSILPQVKAKLVVFWVAPCSLILVVLLRHRTLCPNRCFPEITGEIIRKSEAPAIGHHFRWWWWVDA